MNSADNNVQQFVIAFSQFSPLNPSPQHKRNVPHMKHTLHTVFHGFAQFFCAPSAPSTPLSAAARVFLRGNTQIKFSTFAQRLCSCGCCWLNWRHCRLFTHHTHARTTHTRAHHTHAHLQHAVRTHTVYSDENRKNKLVACNLIWNVRAFIKQNENCEKWRREEKSKENAN